MNDNEHKDFHLKDGVKHWTVTTCLDVINNPELNKFRGFKGNYEADKIMNETGDIGNFLHGEAKKIIKSNGFYTPDTTHPIKKFVVEKFNTFAMNEILDIKHFEERFFSMKYKYCGRIDGMYLLKGKSGFDLCDIKPKRTNRILKILTAWQLAAYKNLLIEKGIKVNDRVVIEYTRNDNTPVKAIKVLSNYKTDFYNFLTAKSNYLALLK